MRIGDPFSTDLAKKIGDTEPNGFRFTPPQPWQRGLGYTGASDRIVSLSFEEDRCDIWMTYVAGGSGTKPSCHLSAEQFAQQGLDALRVTQAKIGDPSERRRDKGGIRYVWNFEPRGVGCDGKRKLADPSGRLALVGLDLLPDYIGLTVIGLNPSVGRLPASSPPMVEIPCPYLPRSARSTVGR